jgi:cysteine desulfurase
MRQIYFDYCATTPVHPTVREAMLPALEADFGNPSSMHWAGQAAARLKEQARVRVANALVCSPEEIIFTSGATEADNLALMGVMHCHRPGEAHLITTAIEHHAVLHTAQALEREGYAVTYLPVDGSGLVDPQSVLQAIRPETVLISAMLVNNEVGSIQPVREIGALAHERNIVMHTDAVQGLCLPDATIDRLNVDLLSLSAHKIYGPKGIGALYVRQGIELAPLMFGGAQENTLRPGTENMAGILGLAAALELVQAHKTEQHQHLTELRQRMISGLRLAVPGVIINGPADAIAPHVLSATFPNADGETLLFRLSSEGFAVSMGSACTSKDIEPLHVLKAMGLSLSHIEGTLRISFGFPTREDEIDAFLAVLPEIYQKSLVD